MGQALLDVLVLATNERVVATLKRPSVLAEYKDKWAGDSLKMPPPHSKYADSSISSSIFRQVFFDPSRSINGPKKGAQILIRIAGLPNPPLRLQLGTGSMAIVRSKAKETAADAEKYADIAHSANLDGVDKNAILSIFGMYVVESE